jgi:hypothetical protein
MKPREAKAKPTIVVRKRRSTQLFWKNVLNVKSTDNTLHFIKF